jgi:hypothetical protein
VCLLRRGRVGGRRAEGQGAGRALQQLHSSMPRPQRQERTVPLLLPLPPCLLPGQPQERQEMKQGKKPDVCVCTSE